MIAGALLGLLLAAGGDPCAGEEFQLCFDPDNRLALGAGAAVTEESEVGVAYELSVELGSERRSRTRDDLTWSAHHELLHARLVRTAAEERLSGVAYRGRFDRHLEEGSIVLPGAVPVRVPFPFDLAIELETGALSRTAAGDRLGLLSAALLLDPVRDPAAGFQLGVGPALAWSVSRRAGTDEALHELSPLTGGLLLVSLTDATGRTSVQGRLHAGWAFVPGGASGLQGSAELSLERVLLAVNDRPVSLRLAGTAQRSDVGVESASPVEWVASLGLVAAPF